MKIKFKKKNEKNQSKAQKEKKIELNNCILLVYNTIENFFGQLKSQIIRLEL